MLLIDYDSKYKNPTYDSKFCDELIESAKRGEYQVEFACLIGAHESALYRWAEQYPEFRTAKQMADQFRHAYMCNLGRASTIGIRHDKDGNVLIPQFNTAMWIFQMKAKYKWQEIPPPDPNEDDRELLFVKSEKIAG